MLSLFRSSFNVVNHIIWKELLNVWFWGRSFRSNQNERFSRLLGCFFNFNWSFINIDIFNHFLYTDISTEIFINIIVRTTRVILNNRLFFFWKEFKLQLLRNKFLKCFCFWFDIFNVWQCNHVVKCKWLFFLLNDESWLCNSC